MEIRTRLTREDAIALGTIATRDEAGSHFTAIYPLDWLNRMEAARLITIHRPVHANGLVYAPEYWCVDVAEEVGAWFDARGEYIDEAHRAGCLFGDDGTCWETDDGESFQDVMHRLTLYSERSPRHDRLDVIRHVFGDGSGIVETEGGWDYEGPVPFSWAGQPDAEPWADHETGVDTEDDNLPDDTP